MDRESSSKTVPAKGRQKEEELGPIPGEEIGRVMTSYIVRIMGLCTAVGLSTKALQDYMKTKLAEWRQYAKKYNLDGSDGEQGAPQPHLEDHMKTLGQLSGACTRVNEAQRLVPRSLFVCMVSEYESLLARLLTAVFNLKPEMCI